MEYPNLFPGVDVSNLEDGDESMAYGTLIIKSKIDSLDANANRRHCDGMAPAPPLLPRTHQDANMGKRQYVD